MFRLKHALFIVALTSLASVGVVPAYAHEGPPTPEKPAGGSKTETTEKAKPACTPGELTAFVAAVKAEQAAKAKREAAGKKAGSEGDHRKLRAEGTPRPAGDVPSDADRAARREAEKKAEAARKAEKQKQHAAEEKARLQKYIAKACANAKAEAAARARKLAEQKAAARKFQAIGIVAVTDSTAGSVTVFVKAGDKDLHKRRLVIKVTDGTLIKVDGEKAVLASLVSGTFVSVHGVRAGDTLVAARINAASAGIQQDEPAASPSQSVSPTEGS